MSVLSLIIGILVLLLFILVFAAIKLVFYVSMPKRSTIEEAIVYAKEKGFWKDFDSYEKEEVEIKSYDDYLLHGILLKNDSKKFVIITHGYTDNRYGSVKYCHMYRRMGYQVLLYDLRHHGENKSCYCSMGYKEHKDILAVADYLKITYGNDITICLHGESLGCASSILALGKREDFDFCVADCGFSDLYKLLAYQAKQSLHIPAAFARLTSAMCYLMHGHNFSGIRPIDSFKTNKTPIFFIHGAADDFIPAQMSKDMYEACQSYKKIAIVEGAAHARSYEKDQEKYEEMVEKFLKEKPVLFD